MLLKKVFVTVFFSLLLLQQLAAQTTFSSVEEIWSYADAHNITIRNAAYELEKANAGRKQSYMAFLPQVGASASITDNINLQTTLLPSIIIDRNATVGQVTAVQFGQKYIYQAGATAQLDVLNLQTWFNIQVARETEALSMASLDNTRKTIYRQLAAQYYSYLLMKEAEQLARRSMSITDSVYLSVQHKYEEGLVNESNVDLAKINRSRAEQALTNATYQAATALNNLKGLLNFGITDSVSLSGDLNMKISADENMSFTEDPSVKQAYYQAKVALGRYKVSNAAYIPLVSIAYSNTTQRNDNSFEPFGGNVPWYPASFLSFRASWNLFAGGTRWLQARQNKIGWYESKLQYDNAQKQSAINDDNLRLAYRRTQALAAQGYNIMALSLDNYRHISERYDAGIATLDDRLNAFADYINYQNQYLNSLSDALVQVYVLRIRQR